MSPETSDKRSRLVETAARLVYEHGFRKTTLADIAAAAGVPAGNVYYYFKTKEDIGGAVLERRLTELDMMLGICSQAPTPRERLLGFVRMTVDNRERVALGGCPMGSLCAELQKEGGALAEQSRVLFVQLLAWTEVQFRELGKAEAARALGLHLVAMLQGISLLASTFHDPQLLALESQQIESWLQTL